jgi:hypothetical protein
MLNKYGVVTGAVAGTVAANKKSDTN